MPDAPRPTIAISMGDPLGIGPEVTVKALADAKLRKRARFLVYGTQAALQAAADEAGIEPFWWRARHDSPAALASGVQEVVVLDHEQFSGLTPDRLDRARNHAGKDAGEASFRFVEGAIGAALRPAGEPLRADAVVTAPICKQAWALAGKGRWPGHTELFAARTGAKRWAMMFLSPRLRVVLATVHLPLMEVRDALTIGRVFDAIELAHAEAPALGLVRARIAVCGLNPHAGESGLLGDDESRVITPAITMAREAGMDVRGPFPADTVFLSALRAEHDIVVAMYHDQGLIPVKLLDWERAVNLTIGLPFVRTSPDHGTAFDIAGQNEADERSMKAAIDLAASLACARARA